MTTVPPVGPTGTAVTSALLAEHNLQALVELVYVRTGNEVMASAMVRLDNALTLTQSSLDDLTQLQQLHNQISVQGKGKFPFDYSAGGATNQGNGTLTIPEHTEVTTFSGSLSAIFTTTTSFNQASFSSLTTTLISGVTNNTTTSFPVTGNSTSLNGTSTVTFTVTSTRNLFTSSTSIGSIVNSLTFTSQSSLTTVSTSVASGTTTGSTSVSVSTLVTFSTPQTSNPSSTIAVFVPSTTTGVDAGGYISTYEKIASAFYGQPIDPIFQINGITIYASTQPEYTQFLSSLTSLKARLASQINLLSQPGNTPRDAAGNPDPTSLLVKLKTVYSELPALSSFTSVKKWVLDGYDAHGASGITTSGIKQQHITDAIVAAQSTNDSQKEAVRRYMFVFEEYYKSAAGVLNKITQLIEKMAQNIGK